jgi:hypothetical protein
MACGAIFDPFPVLDAEALLVRRPVAGHSGSPETPADLSVFLKNTISSSSQLGKKLSVFSLAPTPEPAAIQRNR